MTEQSKRSRGPAEGDVESVLAVAIERDFGSGRLEVQSNIVHAPQAQKVAARLAERDSSPHGRMKVMVDEARAKIAEFDDQREKLESMREVQVEEAEAMTALRINDDKAVIAVLEKRIAGLLEDISRADADGRARVVNINAAIDKQVDALDQMEAWQRNIVETASMDVTPRKGKKKDDDHPF